MILIGGAEHPFHLLVVWNTYINASVFVPQFPAMRKITTKLYLYYLCTEAITKTCLYNFDPLKPHFYTVKLGFAWVYIIFVISAKT